MFARFDENPAMPYNRISIKPYIKSHLELPREITQKELAPSPYFFILSICLAYMNMFARFDENPAMTLRVIKETKLYGRTDGRTDKNYKLLHAYVQCVYILSAKYQIAPSRAVVGVDWPIKALSMHIQKPYKGIIV